MASRKTLNAENLQALGAARLAAVLMELGEDNAAVKRRLRLELAGASSPAELAKEIRKRLATIARSRGFVDWQNRKALVNDLETQRRAIVETVAKQDPAEGLDLMWRFMELAGSVFHRTDDGSGVVAGVFRAATGDLGAIAEAARIDPKVLADQVYNCLNRNHYGEYDDLIPTLKTALGPAGLEHLKQRMVALSKQPVSRPADKDRRTMAWGSSGPIYADEIEEQSRNVRVRSTLRAIADAQGDADAFIAQYDEATRKVPAIAANVARRLLDAGRVDEAWQAIEATDPRGAIVPGLEDMRIAVLEALGRGEDAQAARWSYFERALSAPHLRDYLKKLPDFDDFEAEQRALDYVEQHKSLMTAVAFLIQWPALDRAARIVVQRAAELNGNLYEYLTPAAEALAGRYPPAATLLLRAMIDFTLKQARTTRYGHAARHLRNCAGLAASIADWGDVETHDAYAARLRREHGRKVGFWQAVG